MAATPSTLPLVETGAMRSANSDHTAKDDSASNGAGAGAGAGAGVGGGGGSTEQAPSTVDGDSEGETDPLWQLDADKRYDSRQARPRGRVCVCNALPGDMVRDQVRSRLVMTAVLFLSLISVTRLTITLGLFKWPEAAQPPAEVAVHCPLSFDTVSPISKGQLENEMRSMVTQALALALDLGAPLEMKIAIASAESEGNNALLLKKLKGMQGAFTLLGAEYVHALTDLILLPGLHHILAQGVKARMPGKLAGIGAGSPCDMLWSNVSSAEGAWPPPAVRLVTDGGQGVTYGTAFDAPYVVSVETLRIAVLQSRETGQFPPPLCGGGDADSIPRACGKHAASQEAPQGCDGRQASITTVGMAVVTPNKAGFVSLPKLLQGYSTGMYAVRLVAHSAGDDDEGKATARSPMCLEAWQRGLGDGAAQVLTMSVAEAMQVQGGLRIVLDSAPPAHSSVPSGSSVSLQGRVLGEDGGVVGSVVTCDVQFGDLGANFASVMPVSQSVLSYEGGAFQCNFTVRAANAPKKMTVVVQVPNHPLSTQSLELEMTPTVAAASFQQAPIQGIRVGAPGPYGFQYLLDTSPFKGVSGRGIPTALGGHDRLSALNFAPETRQPPTVCVTSQPAAQPARLGLHEEEVLDLMKWHKDVEPEATTSPGQPVSNMAVDLAVVDLNTAVDVGIALTLLEMMPPRHSDVRINTTATKQFVLAMLGVPPFYAEVHWQTLASLNIPGHSTSFSLPKYNLSRVTGEDGCVTFDDLRIAQGSDAWTVMYFGSDKGVVGSLMRQVQPATPTLSMMNFIAERGLFAGLWVIGYLGLLVVLVCLAKSCDACCCQVCNVVCISILVVNVLFLCFVAIFGSSGWYLRTVQNDDQLITFSPSCCTLGPSASAADLAALLWLGVTILLLAAAVFGCAWEQCYCGRQSKARAEAVCSAADGDKASVWLPVAAGDDGGGGGSASAAEPLLGGVHVDDDGDGGGASVQTKLSAVVREQFGSAERRPPTWWQRFVNERGQDDTRLRVYRAAMAGFLKVPERLGERAADTKVQHLLSTASRDRWASYKWASLPVLRRYWSAYKIVAVSVAVLLEALWWLLYHLFVLLPVHLVRSQRLPAGFGDTLSRVALHVAVSVGQLALSVALLPWETLVFLYMLLIDSNPLLASGHGGQAAVVMRRLRRRSSFHSSASTSRRQGTLTERLAKAQAASEQESSSSSASSRHSNRNDRCCFCCSRSLCQLILWQVVVGGRRTRSSHSGGSGTTGYGKLAAAPTASKSASNSSNYREWSRVVLTRQRAQARCAWMWVRHRIDVPMPPLGVALMSRAELLQAHRDATASANRAGGGARARLLEWIKRHSKPGERTSSGDKAKASSGPSSTFADQVQRVGSSMQQSAIKKEAVKHRPHLPFFYPTRLIWACVASLFLTICICGAFCALGAWGISVIQDAAAARNELASELELRVPLTSHLTPRYRLALVIIGYALGFLGYPSPTWDIIMFLVPNCAPALALLVCGIMIFVWWRMFRLYKRRILAMRRGDYFVPRQTTYGSNATHYIGYQTVHSIVGTIIVGTVMTSITVFILLLILVPPLRLLLWGKALSSVVYLLPTIIIWLALRMLGMLAIDGAFRVKHVTLFAYQDATMLVVNMIVGIFIVLKRLLLLTFFLMFSFWRLDLVVGSTVRFDTGFTSYVATIMLDHTANAPLKVVFIDLARREINILRTLRYAGTRHARYRQRANSLDSSPTATPGVELDPHAQPWSLQQQERILQGPRCRHTRRKSGRLWRSLACLCCCCFSVPRHELDSKVIGGPRQHGPLPQCQHGSSCPSGDAGHCRVQQRVKRQRNLQRWHLLIMLHRHPDLQALRKHALRSKLSFQALNTKAVMEGVLRQRVAAAGVSSSMVKRATACCGTGAAAADLEDNGSSSAKAGMVYKDTAVVGVLYPGYLVTFKSRSNALGPKTVVALKEVLTVTRLSSRQRTASHTGRQARGRSNGDVEFGFRIKTLQQTFEFLVRSGELEDAWVQAVTHEFVSSAAVLSEE